MKTILSADELKRLGQVIGEIEKSTSGEIRLMIVGRSGPQGPVLATVWLLIYVIGMVGLWVERHRLILTPDWITIPAVALGSGLLAVIFSRFEFIQRWFTPNDMEAHHAWTRAQLEFHNEGLAKTRDHTGILLFLSLFEHKAIVLADQGIASKLPKDTWKDVVGKMLEGAKSGSWAPRLEEALKMCGQHLAAHFPAKPDDKNELPNTVIVKP